MQPMSAVIVLSHYHRGFKGNLLSSYVEFEAKRANFVTLGKKI